MTGQPRKIRGADEWQSILAQAHLGPNAPKQSHSPKDTARFDSIKAHRKLQEKLGDIFGKTLGSHIKGFGVGLDADEGRNVLKVRMRGEESKLTADAFLPKTVGGWPVKTYL
jgi:hypothetical protein